MTMPLSSKEIMKSARRLDFFAYTVFVVGSMRSHSLDSQFNAFFENGFLRDARCSVQSEKKKNSFTYLLCTPADEVGQKLSNNHLKLNSRTPVQFIHHVSLRLSNASVGTLRKKNLGATNNASVWVESSREVWIED